MEGVKYYRIKQINVTGNFSYSSIVKLANGGKGSISIYPNPAKDILTINNASIGNIITVTDVQGKILQTQKVIANTYTIDIRSSQSGVYFIKTNNRQAKK